MSPGSTNSETESNWHGSMLRPRTPAPDFTLRYTPDQSVSLSQFRGKPVVLAFYPADWSPVCGDQMALYNQMLDEFQAFQRSSWAFRSIACGVTPLSPGTTSCTF